MPFYDRKDPVIQLVYMDRQYHRATQLHVGLRVVVSRPSVDCITYYRSQDSQFWHSVSGVCVVRGEGGRLDLLGWR